jgi:hypothetical protein
VRNLADLAAESQITIGDIPVVNEDAPVRREPSVTEAFDRANLVFTDSPPPYPKNPVPSGGKKRGRPVATAAQTFSGRPAGASDLEGLFATGIILLLAFGVGDWASPTAEEATAVAAPLANIVARRIDLATKLGKDASDVIALAIAILSYLSRVGPIAAERVREGMYERRQRAARNRVDRAGLSERPDIGTEQGGMASGQPDAEGAYDGSPFDPINALAKARRNGREVLDRDLGNVAGPDPAVAG